MQRDFKSKGRKFAVKQSRPDRNKWSWPLSIVCMIFIFCGMGFFIVQYKKNVSWLDNSSLQLVNYFSTVKNWLHKPQQNSAPPSNKLNNLVVQKASAEPQFIFYSALSNMQISPHSAQVTKEIPRNSKILPKAPTIIPVKSFQAFSAENLENELAQHLQKDNYTLQLAVFQTYAAAQQYKRKLNKQGHPCKIITATKTGKKIYRVQLGPFFNIQQVRVAQEELQKLGVSGIVRKS